MLVSIWWSVELDGAAGVTGELSLDVSNKHLAIQIYLVLHLRETAKSYSFSGLATKRKGRGVRAWPLKKKNFCSSKKNPKKMWPLSSRRGEWEGLSGRATK